ncbi:MAG: DUF692 domain-containing protein [Gammaproteobacteria bacterium]|nr:DUF692 domain-containing protein [Gammaproteobacteria bacterium]
MKANHQWAGIGLRHPHYQDILAGLPDLGWLELHPENYFGKGGLPHEYLSKIATHYDLSFHGVGMSLGGEPPLDLTHLKRLGELIEVYKPVRISEHMSFSAVPGRHMHDLLPMLYTSETLTQFCDRVKFAQDYLGRQLLIENPSSYLQFTQSTIPEWEFFASLPQHTGCGLLLDVNNVYVTCQNHGFDADDYLTAVNASDVEEIHLAGHTLKHFPEGSICIDDHGSEIKDAVWELYAQTIAAMGPKPTLIEWDTQIPSLSVLMAQRELAQQKLEGLCGSQG